MLDPKDFEITYSHAGTTVVKVPASKLPAKKKKPTTKK